MREMGLRFLMVIFGCTGDLAMRKLIPSLYRILRDGYLSENFAIISVGRTGFNDDQYRDRVRRSLSEFLEPGEVSEEIIQKFLNHLHYFSANPSNANSYSLLKNYLEELDREVQAESNMIFYMAVPSSLFDIIPSLMFKHGLLDESKGWRRVVFEKPFGHDLDSARRLNQTLLKIMKETQIYRIDHYLGKETVQNIMAFRFANGIFEPIWNRHYIDSVQITVAEEIGIESRSGYYDQTGALRDMVPNHIFQILSLIAMEAPNSFESEEVRNEKVKLLRAIKPFSPQDVLRNVVRGQYAGYRNEPGVSPTSNIETFAALKLEIENWRWAGVPFYARTGKRLKKRLTTATIAFKCPPFQMFQGTECKPFSSNQFIFEIQPEEKVDLCFEAKQPGQEMVLKKVALEFDYKNVFGRIPKTGYETLLFDCMRGDSTLFQRADQVDTAWKVVEPILEVWSVSTPHFPNYNPGTWGPVEADELLELDGRVWREAQLEREELLQVESPSRKVA